jgi:hypothetical protein
MRHDGSGLAGSPLRLAGALIAFAPGVVQDASLARPESLVYLLSASFLWTLTLPLAERWRMLCAGAVLGAGIAVKLTFASLAIMLPFLVAPRGRSLRDLAATAACLAAGAAAAIAAAAPYALIHFDVYLNGLAALAAQYNGAHPPHSLPIYDAVSQTAWIGAYFVQLYGFGVPAALMAPFLLQGMLRCWAFALVSAWLILFVYFASKTVFFERNFAHVLIPLLLAAALGIGALKRSSWRIAAALLTLLPMAYWSMQIVRAIWTPKRLAQFESAHALETVHRVHFPQIYFGDVPAQCDIIALHDDFNDPWTRSYLEKLRQRGFHQIAHFHSGFGPLVTSTLHTSVASDVRYFRCPSAAASPPGPWTSRVCRAGLPPGMLRTSDQRNRHQPRNRRAQRVTVQQKDRRCTYCHERKQCGVVLDAEDIGCRNRDGLRGDEQQREPSGTQAQYQENEYGRHDLRGIGSVVVHGV